MARERRAHVGQATKLQRPRAAVQPAVTLDGNFVNPVPNPGFNSHPRNSFANLYKINFVFQSKILYL